MIFHTAGNNEKKIFIMNNEKKKIFDAVGWKSYWNTKKKLYCGAGRAGAGRWACWRWALGVLALGAGRAGAGRAGRARGQQARRRQAAGRGARGACAAGAEGARPGRLGWPGLCTRCTRLDFQTGFQLGIFPESVNEHCSL